MSGSWFNCQNVKRNPSIISQWTFQLFSLHNDLLHCKFHYHNCSFFQLIFKFSNFNSKNHLLDLLTISHDLEWIKIAETFSTILFFNGDMVHGIKSYFQLQTSLVRCIGWRFNGCNLCITCGMFTFDI